MGALDGFYSTWNKARETFGQGAPTDGSQFDQSRSLTQMKASVEAAAPDDRWQGSGANAYAAANKEHAQVYQKLADLDQKMAAEVKNAANVVSAGRTNLDNAKSWVEGMANSLPATSQQDRERKLIPIAREGINRVDNIVKSATADMMGIKGNVEKLRGEYDTIKTTMRFGPESEKKPGDKKDDAQMLGNEEKDDDGIPEMHAPSTEDQARMDVEQVLSEGDGGAAERVDEVLSSIKPGDELTPQQDAYLSEMQRQQKGMSVEDLRAAEQRLGDHKNVIADSWQLMSNDDVEYSAGAGDDKKGAASQLPDSVQKALTNAGDTWPIGDGIGQLRYEGDLKAISEIVKDGNPGFQTGTELDRQLIVAADKAMDARDIPGGQILGRESTVQSLFEAVDDDHQIINDHLMGRNGVDVDDFLRDVNTTDWPDNGKAAGYLFSWTNEASSGPEAEIAAQTADKYAEFIGAHTHGEPTPQPDLLNINGQTLGQLNPELVQRYAHGLIPYVDDMGGIGDADKFEIDGGDLRRDGLMPNAKGVFAVLNTDPVAATEINARAYEIAMERETSFATNPKDPSAQAHLYAAATMRGLVDVGAHEAFQAFKENGYDAGVDQTAWKKAGFDAAVTAVSTGASVIPGVGFVSGPTVAQIGSIFSNEMFDNAPPPVDRPLPEMSTTRASHLILDAMLAAGNPLTLPEGWVDYTDPERPRVVQPPGVNDDVYASTINAQVGEQSVAVDAKGPDQFYADRYNNVAQDIDIQHTPPQEERHQ
ncbi:hypothetical protein LTT02_27805 [Mycolicibacterium smegmatis]|uniref:TPR repeat region-containing protein n=1 Tax=Mycolicibacterium smegmatis TaxID=1772 RepID=UPI0005D765F7|nr:EspA/EspE family type VII secretion system effector [Mycolicibacterium smegmatis]MDF1899816.1 EspA/EspE family type VII secretion system effector [Mycolicibacterium smegmatis]MDF1909558.1 EspA/EspE family type VII secretion system effector [Mycolicibacterium smegmatis]MDF1916267.1 EspA/EspE family type VII secretion system effector [Mycolicibacterium smegmatis]MDF1927936.1 EspA/EspE family type VII secretion system effector [Mycolicibacterium smegmatis]UAK56659.1 hypothetical protein K8P01_